MADAPHVHTDPDCLFCKIVAGTVPSRKVHEDDEFYAFHDIRPAAPIHLLIIPKEHFPGLREAQERHKALLGRLLLLAPRLAAQEGAGDGFRTVINTGPEGGQEVYHLHAHVLAGPQPWKRG